MGSLDSVKWPKNRQGPTPGVRLTEVSVKRELTVFFRLILRTAAFFVTRAGKVFRAVPTFKTRDSCLDAFSTTGPATLC